MTFTYKITFPLNGKIFFVAAMLLTMSINNADAHGLKSYDPFNAPPLIGGDRAYVCYFDKASSIALNRCKKIVQEAIIYWRNISKTRDVSKKIYIIGYSSELNSSRDNVNLGLKRSLYVSSLFLNDGFDKNFLKIVSLGEKNIPIPNKKDDPLNRLVWIYFE